MRVPSSMPAGMLTESLRSSVMRPAPAHSGQGSEITSPRPWQAGQVRSIEKKPCAARMRPVTVAGRADARLRAAAGAAAGAGLADDLARHLDLGGAAGIGLLERDLHVVAEVAAALAAGAAAAALAAAAHEVAEDVVEDVRHRGGEIGVEAGAAIGAVLEGGMAEAVIGGPLLRVLQRLVGLVDFLELVLGRRDRCRLRSGWNCMASLRKAPFSSFSSQLRWTPRTS